MTRNIKALGLALVAVAAMSMAAASMAQAAQLHATSSKNVVITGSQKNENVFQVTTTLAGDAGPKVKCAQAAFESTVQWVSGSQVTAEELTVTPIYNDCTAFGQNATVKMNGCHYTVTGVGQGVKTAVVDVVCATAGKQIEIQTSICQVRVPAQTTTQGHITFTNVAGPPQHTVEAVITVTTIKHEYASGIGCGHTKTASTSDGEYEGSIHFQAFEDVKNDQVQRNGDGHLYTEYTHAGVPLGLEAT